jgi:hypothetical protein
VLSLSLVLVQLLLMLSVIVQAAVVALSVAGGGIFGGESNAEAQRVRHQGAVLVLGRALGSDCVNLL